MSEEISESEEDGHAVRHTERKVKKGNRVIEETIVETKQKNGKWKVMSKKTKTSSGFTKTSAWETSSSSNSKKPGRGNNRAHSACE